MLNLSSTSERGSRNSIVSLFRVGTSSSGGGVKSSVNSHKLNENVIYVLYIYMILNI